MTILLLGISIISIYNPGSNTDQASFKQDILKLGKLKGKSLICGDFNAKHRLWNCIKGNSMGKVLFDVIQRGTFSLHYPDEPTYIPSDHRRSPSTLDLILDKGQVAITSLSALKIFTSDHFPVYFEITDSKIISKNPYLIPNYARGNWKLFKDTINNRINPTTLNLKSITNTTQIDSMVTYLTKLINLSQKTAVPLTHPVQYSLKLPDPITGFFR